MFVKLQVHCYSVLLLASYKLHCWSPNQVLLNAEEHNISEIKQFIAILKLRAENVPISVFVLT